MIIGLTVGTTSTNILLGRVLITAGQTVTISTGMLQYA